ncbi:hypothetical protein DY000_02060223 [Brassica cretica]|uniref:Uncharacterized protein n=1 Tax=Brassica cretica TaxID=69181 RepID=A0ABQ7AP23_BRACR|nr:hypothetical protein DY000_02060223 [Brassica cretica]
MSKRFSTFFFFGDLDVNFVVTVFDPNTSDRASVRARSLRSDRASVAELGRYVATERKHARSLRSDRASARARSLCSDRASTRARSLRSDLAERMLGRYVATELWLELGRYVATEWNTRSVAA